MQTSPELIFSEEELYPLVKRLCTPLTLIVTDEHNYPELHDIAPTVLVFDQEEEHIEEVKRTYHYDKVIAVGGCTALDFGRACAISSELIAIPTILSNSCISMDRSVIKRNGVYKSEKTIAPKQTIISLPTIVHNHEDITKQWSASGIGDLLSAISASIEFEYRENNKSFTGITTEKVKANIPSCVEALSWIINELDGFDQNALETLARYLHDSSLTVAKNGGTYLKAASEHWLYYKMQERQTYDKAITTHGRLVSMGNLITLRIFGEAIEDFSLYDSMRIIHKKIGLPLSYDDLQHIKIEKSHIIQGIEDLYDRDCLYADYFTEKEYSLLDRIFAV